MPETVIWTVFAIENAVIVIIAAAGPMTETQEDEAHHVATYHLHQRVALVPLITTTGVDLFFEALTVTSHLPPAVMIEGAPQRPRIVADALDHAVVATLGIAAMTKTLVRATREGVGTRHHAAVALRHLVREGIEAQAQTVNHLQDVTARTSIAAETTHRRDRLLEEDVMGEIVGVDPDAEALLHLPRD